MLDDNVNIHRTQEQTPYFLFGAFYKLYIFSCNKNNELPTQDKRMNNPTQDKRVSSLIYYDQF